MQKNFNAYIDDPVFKSIIKHIPLISLDFVVRRHGKVLLGKRLNKPAKGYWFTVGGRIFKDEKINDTIHRIAKEELGVELTTVPKFIGVFEHFYDDAIYEDVSTHYVNLVYEVDIDALDDLPDEQHNAYRWFDVEELLLSDEVHRYVKDIFAKGNENE